jgi:hypothetical protein
MERIKERFDFPDLSYISSFLSDCSILSQNIEIRMTTGYEKIVFHDVTVKWCIELFNSGPVIFYCVPYIVSSL